MFTSKKYVKAVNAKGIFDNTYEARIEQTELSQKNSFNARCKLLSLIHI